jgi:hypothetical protein
LIQIHRSGHERLRSSVIDVIAGLPGAVSLAAMLTLATD